MLIRQSINSFIRCTDNYGYITNQLTRHDRSYDKYGAIILRLLARTPQSLEDIVHKLLEIFDDVDYDTLENDIREFITSLAKDKFIVTGDTVEELDNKDEKFSYSVANPKTLASDFSQITKEKVKDNTQEFFLEKLQGRPIIQNLEFELSSRCNERCIHCYIPNSKKNVGINMPTQKVKSILDEFTSMGGLHVTLSGGEAFMHPDLLEIARYSREKDLMVTILSNLTFLKDEHIQIMKDLNLSLIQTSLYSMNPEIHDMITTVKGSFAKTKKAIEKLVVADIPVQISCPIMKANYKGYNDVLDYAESLKINAQTDYIMMAEANFDTSNLANRISLKETETLLREVMEHDISYANETLMQKPISEEIKFDKERYLKEPICGVGYDNCCIAANGDVYPCAGWQGMILGNVYKQNLKEIWESSHKVKELRKITNASFPECVNCEARDFCAMCLVRNFNESGGDMFKVIAVR